MAHRMGRMTKRNRAKYRRRAHAAGLLRAGMLRIVARAAQPAPLSVDLGGAGAPDNVATNRAA